MWSTNAPSDRVQGYLGKPCYIICSCLPTRNKGTHCVDMASALKSNMFRGGLVFDVVLHLPSISRLRCLINAEIL